MSRRSDNHEGSLELLLDTICNTFGGVLFISILVVILLNTTSKQAAEATVSQSDQTLMAIWQERLDQTARVLNRMEAALAQQASIEEQIIEPELRDTIKLVTQSQQQRVEKTEQRNRDLARISKAQQEYNEANRRWQTMQEQMSERQRELAEVERKLEQEIEARSRAAELPKVRATTKREVVLFLRDGRLCSYARSDRNGNLVVNRREVLERQDETQRAYIEPRPNTGVAIDLEDDNTEKIDERLDQFNSELHYLAIFVWPDSFDHFAIVKDRMVSRQFEYRLIPFPADAKIYFGANEQRVLVQ